MARMLMMMKVFNWQKDSNHSIKQAGQETHYLTDQIHQLGEEKLTEEVLEVMFLNGFS